MLSSLFIYLSCSTLKYDSNNLGTLERYIGDKYSQWRTWGGNMQLAALYRILAAQSLTCLHLEIKCSERLLDYNLRLTPALKGYGWVSMH